MDYIMSILIVSSLGPLGISGHTLPTLDPRQKVDIASTTAVSVNVTWEVAPDDETEQEYYLSYTPDWNATTVNAADGIYLIEDLKPDSVYLITMYAMNGSDLIDPACTIGKTKGLPSSDRLFRVTAEAEGVNVHIEFENRYSVTWVNASCCGEEVCNFTETRTDGSWDVSLTLSYPDQRKGNYTVIADLYDEETFVQQLNYSLEIYKPRKLRLSTTDANVTRGGDLSVICEADCNPVCTYRWTRLGEVMADSGVLSIQNAQRQDKGEYICLVSNPRGNDMTNISVDVYGAPYPPRKTQISQITPTSLTLTWYWDEGWDGGALQVYNISYSPDAENIEVNATKGEYIIDDLEPDTFYTITMYAKNEFGQSDDFYAWGKTKENHDHNVALITLSVFLFLIVCVVVVQGVLLYMFMRRQSQSGVNGLPLDKENQVMFGNLQSAGGDNNDNIYSDESQHCYYNVDTGKHNPNKATENIYDVNISRPPVKPEIDNTDRKKHTPATENIYDVDISRPNVKPSNNDNTDRNKPTPGKGVKTNEIPTKFCDTQKMMDSSGNTRGNMDKSGQTQRKQDQANPVRKIISTFNKKSENKDQSAHTGGNKYPCTNTREDQESPCKTKQYQDTSGNPHKTQNSSNHTQRNQVPSSMTSGNMQGNQDLPGNVEGTQHKCAQTRGNPNSVDPTRGNQELCGHTRGNPDHTRQALDRKKPQDSSDPSRETQDPTDYENIKFYGRAAFVKKESKDELQDGPMTNTLHPDLKLEIKSGKPIPSPRLNLNSTTKLIQEGASEHSQPHQNPQSTTKQVNAVPCAKPRTAIKQENVAERANDKTDHDVLEPPYINVEGAQKIPGEMYEPLDKNDQIYTPAIYTPMQ